MMYLFLTNHRQDVLTSSRKITARKRSPGLAQLNSFEFARDLENQCRSETPLKIFSTVSSQDGRGPACQQQHLDSEQLRISAILLAPSSTCVFQAEPEKARISVHRSGQL
jgi:hypothetical protein